MELWQIGFWEDYFIAAAATDQNGDFQFCLINDPAHEVDLYVVILTCSDSTTDCDACGSLGGTPTDYPVVVTTNTNILYLTHTYDFRAEDICIGTVHWDIVDRRGQHSGAYNIYDLLANDAYDYLAQSVGWYNTHKLTVYFPDESTAFETPNEIVRVAWGDEQDPDILLTTYGYFVLYHLYDGLFPPHTWGCPGHGWGGDSDPGCAWIHGWAYFLQAAVQEDPMFVDTPAPGAAPDVQIDMETPDPAVGGLDDDGAVAATLWDILDTAVESWDELAHSLSEIWTVVEGQPNDLCEFASDFRELYSPGSSLDDILAHHEVDCMAVVDPNPSLLDGADVSTDVALLASGGRPVVGLAADGVTRVLVRRELPEAGTAAFRILDENGLATGVGTLSAPGGNEGDTTLVVATQELPDGRHMAFAVLVAPQDFVREPADNNLAERPINICMTFTPTGGGAEITATRQIALVRPPVMLLHGLWGRREDWTDPYPEDDRFHAWPLISDERFTVHVGDYRAWNDYWIVEIVNRARWGVERAAEKLRRQDIAATQADVIAHSMGGLLSRLYIAEISSEYRRDRNFGAGDIHKLITVDTPHAGSRGANFMVTDSNQVLCLGRVIEWFEDRCVTCGAVVNLRPDSLLITRLPATEQVPVHAIVATGGSTILGAGWEEVLPKDLEDLLKGMQWLCGIRPQEVFPPPLEHDVIVGRDSQEGGLGTGSGHTTVIGYGMTTRPGVHTTVICEDRVSYRAVELLNASVGDASVFAAGFPGPSHGAASESQSAPLYLKVARGGGIKITGPPAGTPVMPGGQVGVTVEAIGGFVADRVLVLSSGGAEFDEEAPFDVLIDIPLSSIGEFRLGAFAFDAGENFAEAPEVVLPVDVSATLTRISIDPETLYLFAFSPKQAVTVMGTYDDGVERDLTPASLRTTYETSDSEVATVDGDGVLTGHRVGSTVITATNGAHVAVANVIVVSALADSDRDRDVDLDDVATFTTCFSGPVNAPGFPMPGTACRDFFDSDGDQDIDLTDFASFQQAFTGPVP